MSYRNNEDRVMTPPSDDPTPHMAVQEEGFSFATPTEFVELPSGGTFYPEDHPLHNQTTVEIKYMTAKDEDILTSPALLKKGLAIDRLVKKILVDKSLDPGSLLAGDKNAILVATRITGYGSVYGATVTCAICSNTGHHDFDLSEMKTHTPDFDELGVTSHGNGEFSLNLPKSGVELTFRALTGRDENNLLKLTERKRKQNLPETTLTDQLRATIAAVNGNRDQNYINQFVNAMPAMDSKLLRRTYSETVPNIDMGQTYACESCGSEEEVTMPFTAEFFWPK